MHDKQYYQLTPELVLNTLQSSHEGLASAEAAHRFERNGPNALVGLKGDPWWRKYLRQFQDWMIALLMVSAVGSWYLGDAHTAIVLIALVFFNTIIGFLQEFRAEKTMQALEKLVHPVAEVYRDGTLQSVESASLVVGDIVRLSEGESVPADIRLIEEMTLSTNDFALTGESNPSRKFTRPINGSVLLGNRHNLAFMGTTVATGEGLGVVIATGMQTELGRIAALAQSAPHEESPLQKEMRHVATYVTYGVVILCLVLLLFAIQANLALKDALLFAVGLAGSLIPQGLPAEINTSLAQAANKLARAKALVKKLSAVETLGATHVICTDKTGTLTKNQMTVEQMLIGQTVYNVSGVGYEPKGEIVATTNTASSSDLIKNFLLVGVLASNARLLPPDKDNAEWHCLGDPTEGALLTVAVKSGLNLERIQKDYSEVRELPFDSGRKRMTSVRSHDGETIVYVKGAPESVLERCSMVCIDGAVRSLTKQDRDRFLQAHTEKASHAMRNLAFAQRSINSSDVQKGDIDIIESGLTLMGMVSMIDPLRETVPAAIKAARDAHIKINVVTGDFALTAEAIARQAGLIGESEKAVVVSGEDLQKLSDKEVLQYSLAGSTIFSRVSPEDKMRIVRLVKGSGHVVAVTGDGINDAPALKHANIGVAMGITGTDVAKQASEVVLLDDSFSSLVGAIREGRTIFANIKKSVLSCFTSNSAELWVNLGSLALTSVLGLPLAINILQLLAIDMLAELFPIAALGWDKQEGEIMRDQPRDPKKHILNRHSIIDLLWCGLVIGIIALVNYLLVFQRAGINLDHPVVPLEVVAQATTVTYVTIVVCQLINIIQRRSIHGFFSAYQLHNRVFWLSIVFSVSIVLSICYVPFVSEFFKSGPLGFADWLYIGVGAIIFLAIREVARYITVKRSVTV